MVYNEIFIYLTNVKFFRHGRNRVQTLQEILTVGQLNFNELKIS